MIAVDIIQGTPEWHQHRATHLNASDAPAMLGVSPYKTRTQLIREVATGISEEHDAGTLQRFADGHRYEALARTIAEQILGEDLYPVVGVLGKYSASFDGLTLLEDTAFEHKSLNDELRRVMVDGCTGADLPEHYRVQMEQQCMVSGAQRVLFMASKWDANDQLIEERHCTYMPDPELRARIVAGWEQFERDVAAYEAPVVAEVVAKPVRVASESLPAILVQVQGQVTVIDNFQEFEVRALDFLDRELIRSPQTDDDFGALEGQIKEIKKAEDALDAAGKQVLAQVETIDSVMRRKDKLSKLLRDNRLLSEKLLSSEKERRRSEIVANGVQAVRDHYASINSSLGVHAIAVPAGLQTDIGAAIKGKKLIANMQDAVSTAVANAKIAASQQADRVRANVAILAEHAEHESLFADRVQLCANKTPEDLRNLVSARINEHKLREQARLDAEREKIRQEEAARLEREQRQREEENRRAQLAEQIEQTAQAPATDLGNAITPAATAQTVAAPVAAGTARSAGTGGARLKLSDINAAIAPLSITGEGLAQLGFHPVATDRAAKLYDASQLYAMGQAMIRSLQRVSNVLPRAA